MSTITRGLTLTSPPFLLFLPMPMFIIITSLDLSLPRARTLLLTSLPSRSSGTTISGSQMHLFLFSRLDWTTQAMWNTCPHGVHVRSSPGVQYTCLDWLKTRPDGLTGNRSMSEKLLTLDLKDLNVDPSHQEPRGGRAGC